jgi:hypothetical protein
MLRKTSDQATIRKVGDRWVVHVPWHDAANLRMKLQRGGFFSEPVLGPGKREPCLEMESLRTIMTSRTGLYVTFAGLAVSAVSTLAFLLPGLSEPGYPVSNLTAVGISLWMAGQLLGVLLLFAGLLMTANMRRGKAALARAGLPHRPRLHL